MVVAGNKYYMYISRSAYLHMDKHERITNKTNQMH